MSIVYLGLGANLGDRLANLRNARKALVATDGLQLQAASRYYETDPVGGPAGQPPFYNAVLQFASTLEPIQLLDKAQELEWACGRRRTEAWGPRTLDIDLLLIDELICSGPSLELPHPRMTTRGFVLAPLAELAPGLLIPGAAVTVSELWERVRPQGGVVCRGEW